MRTYKTSQQNRHKNTKKGGRRFGSGFKGTVMDLCNYKKHDTYNLCKQLNTNNIENIKIYLKQENKSIQAFELNTQEEIDSFIRFIKLPQSKKYVVKEFYNYKIKDSDFQNEMQSYETISKIITKEENLVGMPYSQNIILIGFEIHYKESIKQTFNNELYSILQNNPFEGIADFIHEKINKRLFVINQKCQQTMKAKILNKISVGTFQKFVIEVLQTIIKLNEINVAHGDIKLDNIMICNNRYSLIDWEQSRKLDYYNLKLNLAIGSCPVYYIIKFGSLWESIHTVAIPFIIKVTGCNDRDSKTSSQYISNGVAYYKNIFKSIPEDAAFERVKHGLDLYSFGLVLYGILEHNQHLQHNSKYNKYREFVENIYKYENPKKALYDFQTI
jgi:serine/threonine protein kinase